MNHSPSQPSFRIVVHTSCRPRQVRLLRAFPLPRRSTQLCVFSAVFHEHSGDKDGFCHRAFRWSGRLERTHPECRRSSSGSDSHSSRHARSAEGHAVLDGRQYSRKERRQMLKERSCRGFIVVKRNLLIKNGEISGLLDIGSSTCDQPERVVIEAAADIACCPFW